MRIVYFLVGVALLAGSCKRPPAASQAPASDAPQQAQAGAAPERTVAEPQQTVPQPEQPSTAAASATTEVQWMSFEQAVEKSKTEKRKIFIDVYTDWCGWCKVMDKNTFSEAKVAAVLNEKFYPVKFNAEQRDNVVFNGTTYKFVAKGGSGYHELAAALLNSRLSYPTVVFLDENFGMIQPLAGYMKPEEFHPVVRFIGEDHYKTVKWAEWQATYKSPY